MLFKKVFMTIEAVAHEISTKVITDSLFERESNNIEFIQKGQNSIYYGEWDNTVVVQIISNITNKLIDEYNTSTKIPERIDTVAYTAIVEEIIGFLKSVKELDKAHEPYLL